MTRPSNSGMAHPVEPAVPPTFQAVSMARNSRRIVTDGGHTSVLPAGLAAVSLPSAQDVLGRVAARRAEPTRTGQVEAVLVHADALESISLQSASTGVAVVDPVDDGAREPFVDVDEGSTDPSTVTTGAMDADLTGTNDMKHEVELSDVEATLEQLSYPIGRESATVELSDITLVLADGEANLGELVGATTSDEFESAADVLSSLHTALPREAVGEPYQSEGDA